MTEAIPSPDTANAGDMDTIAERLIPFAPRENTRENLRAVAARYEESLANLNALFHNRRASCPICRDNGNVIITGNGRNGAKKFKCKNEHDPDELPGRSDEKNRDKIFRFSTYTSHEALKVYQDFLVQALTVLTLCGGTFEGLAKLLSISRHMVELGATALVEHLREHQGEGVIETDEDLVLIVADFSGTRVSRSLSFIMARVAGEVTYQVLPAINWVTAWSFVKNIRRVLRCPDGATVVWVTDGELAWVDPIRKMFPEGVHIRQFHRDNLRGLVYVHFPHGGELYTFRCLWDLVLGEGEPSEHTQAMRRYRVESASKDAIKKRDGPAREARTELYDGVILWKGTVYQARGGRRKRSRETRGGATPSGAMEAGTDGLEGGDACDGRSLSTGSGDDGTPGVDGAVAPDSDAPRRGRGKGAVHEVVFKGTLVEGLGNEAVEYAHGILVRAFGGLYISSNKAEVLFEVKAPLRSHRTVKSGTRMILVVLHTWSALRRRSREEIEAYLRDAISLERLRRLVIKRDRGKRVGRDGQREIERLLSRAMDSGEPVIIAYKDRYGRRTGRIIQPQCFTRNEYTGQTRVQAFCHLREDNRTFLLDRISDAMLDDPTIGIIS